MADLVEQGYGGLAIQIIVAPDSTIQSLAKASGGADGRPAIMLEFGGKDGRMPVSLISIEAARTQAMRANKAATAHGSDRLLEPAPTTYGRG